MTKNISNFIIITVILLYNFNFFSLLILIELARINILLGHRKNRFD